MLPKVSKRLLLRPLPLILFFGILQLSVALLSDHLSFDEAMWHYIGRNWFRHGLVPYAGGVDNKSPIIFALFGLSDKFFGVNCWFPRVVGTACQSAGIYYVYRIARRIANESAAIFSITIYGLSVLWKSADGAAVSFTETYAVTCIIISYYYYIDGRGRDDFFISGLIAGLGFGFRISAFFGIAAIFMSYYLRNKSSAILFLSGVVCCVMVIAAVFVAAGIDLHDLLTYSVTDNFSSGSVTDHNLAWHVTSFMNAFFYSEFIMLYPFVLVFFFIKKHNFLTFWLISECIGICTIGTFATTHLKDLLPVMSLMNGLSLSFLVENYKLPLRPILIIIWITYFPKLLNPLINARHLIFPESATATIGCEPPYPPANDNLKKKMGLWIKSHTYVQEPVFVAGYGAIVQAYSERQSPTVYFNVTQTATAKRRLFADLANSKPAMVVIPLSDDYASSVDDDIRNAIDSLVTRNYSYTNCMFSYAVYRLKKPGPWP